MRVWQFPPLRVRFFAAFLLVFVSEAGAQIRFEPTLVTSNRVRISLLGNSGSAYAIEGSTDLVSWSTEYSGVAENGHLEVDVDMIGALKMFYRARQDEGTVPAGLDVTIQLETNYTARAFVLAGGANSRLFSSNRTEFTLSFPSNTVAEWMPATMTIVTNIGAFPFAGPILGAVQINLQDEDLLGSALLSIKFATNVDRRRIVSFTADADGKGFYLTPDRVTGNEVRIPVTHSGIFGACLASTQEIAAVVQTVGVAEPAAATTGLLHAQSEGRLHSEAILNTSRLCFPDDVARALTVRRQILNQMRPISTKLAAQLTAERHAQLAGETDDTPGVLSRAGAIACDFYNKNIAPRWPEASRNCSLMSVLLQFALAFDRQLQLLGVPDPERCTANVLSPQLLCPGFKDCLQEIKLCCMSGHPGKERLRDLVTLTRQQELLGISGANALGCFDLRDDAMKEVIDVCTPRIWRGSLSVKESGGKHERMDYPKAYTELTETFDLEFGGFITDAAEQNLGGLGVVAQLKFEGTFIAREFRDDYSESDGCQVVINRNLSQASVADSSAYSMDLSLQPSTKTYILSLVFGRSDVPFEAPLGDEWNEITSTRLPPDIGCPPGTLVMTTRTSKEIFGGPFLIGYVGTLGANQNIIEGKTTTSGVHFGFNTTVEVEWKLERKVQPQ